jgi:hypothetical protein
MIQNDYLHAKKYLIIFVAIGITFILLCSALFLVNIGIVNAQWNAQSKIEGFKINNSTGKLQETLYVYIDDSSLYAQQLLILLQQRLQSYTTNVKIMTRFYETKEIKNASFLGVHITKSNKKYYPWSAENKHTIFYYFSDVGNTEYFIGYKNAESVTENPVVSFNSSNGKQLLHIGDISIQGSFSGFFSKPKMQDITIEYIANEICKQVNQ